jgi:hypothetical protein
MKVRKGDPTMTLRHISPRSVEWYEALIEDKEEPLAAHEALALRTMKALEDAEIRIALTRAPRPDFPDGESRLAVRLARVQLRHV